MVGAKLVGQHKKVGCICFYIVHPFHSPHFFSHNIIKKTLNKWQIPRCSIFCISFCRACPLFFFVLRSGTHGSHNCRQLKHAFPCFKILYYIFLDDCGFATSSDTRDSITTLHYLGYLYSLNVILIAYDISHYYRFPVILFTTNRHNR